jgi:hypothetical protein
MTTPPGSADEDPIPRSGPGLLSPAYWAMMAFAAACLAGALLFWFAAPRLGLVRPAPPARPALARGAGTAREATQPPVPGSAGH